METIYEKVALAQDGNEPAMLSLIQQFSPLLKKYAYLLRTEDSFHELQADFIELIMTLKLASLRSHNDGTLVNYINSVVRNRYILRSKQNQADSQILHWEDFDEAVQRKHEPQCPLLDEAESFFQSIPLGALNKKEQDVIIKVYLYHYSVAEIARLWGTTRQAVNQLKQRALKKLEKEIVVPQDSV